MELAKIGEINKVCVVGLGNVGIPTALHIQSKGFEVVGIDKKYERVEMAREVGIMSTLSVELSEPHARDGFDAFVVCVGTGFEENRPDMRNIYKVAADIRCLKRPPRIVSFESTMYPGTTRFVADEIMNNDIPHVMVCPHRWWGENPEKYGVVVPRILGIVRDRSRKVGFDFYTKMLGIPISLVSTTETAELSKITENGRRYVDISYTEYIKMLCDENDVDFEELRAAVNTHFAHEMLEARNGIGGECLPLAVKYLNDMRNSNLLLGAEFEDSCYRKLLIEKVRGENVGIFKTKKEKEEKKG